MRNHSTARFVVVLGALFLVLPILACDSGLLVAARAPRWACPSPTPKPFGENGPAKQSWQECATDPVTGVQTCETREEYYAEWEQEYGDAAGGPPFPSPTPYAMTGTAYAFGQRVEVWPFHVLVDVEHGPRVNSPGAPSNSRLYRIRITWLNHTTAAVPMDYTTRVRLRSVTDPTGRIVSSESWGVTAPALAAAAITVLPDAIPPGESSVVVPILGPEGTAKTVDVVFAAQPASFSGASPTVAPVGTPTVPLPTPTFVGQLIDQTPPLLTVQWNAITLRNGPGCDSPGAITGWGEVGDQDLLVPPAPAGDARVLHVALNQVGKPYVWGAKGPERFDCSGLTEWSYGQIGVRIPRGTAGQWPQMRPVEAAQLQPGDLIFFAIGGKRIDHVGLVGDFNGDGQWDVLHAASPELGVRIDYSVLQSAYYAPRVRGFRTARG